MIRNFTTLFFLTVCGVLLAQEFKIKPGKAIIVVNHDQTEHLGIVSSGNDSVFTLVKGRKDSMVFVKGRFLEVVEINENNVLKGKRILEDHFYNFSPSLCTAFPLKKRILFYTNTNVIVNSLYYGVTDRLSFSMSTSPVMTPIGISARYSVPLNDHFYLAPELGVGSGSWIFSRIKAMHLGCRATQGNSQRNMTAGFGYFYLNGFRSYFKRIELGDSIGIAYVNLAYKLRVSKMFSLNADLWYFDSQLIPIRNGVLIRPQFFVSSLFLRYHKESDKQWRFGMVFVSARVPKRGWRTLPIPAIQWNYMIK